MTTTLPVFPPFGASIARLQAHVGSRGAARIKEFGDAFLILHSGSHAKELGPMRTRDARQDENADDKITGETQILVFALRRQTGSEHPFVSVGRVDGNDVAIVDETVSKFHAYFKEGGPNGGVLVQDARSRNGTFVDDKPVAARGSGPPSPVARGQSVRFGSVSTVFLDAAGVFELLQAVPRG
jgi:hypothetical protein